MSQYEVTTDSAGFAALREALVSLEHLSRGERVHLVELGKAYQKLAQAMVDVANEAGHPSLRFEAIVKALDLRTKKSALATFLGTQVD